MLILVLGIPLGVDLARREQILRSSAASEQIVFSGTNVLTRNGKKVATSSQVTLQLNSPIEVIEAAKSALNYTPADLVAKPKPLVQTVYAQNFNDACNWTQTCDSFQIGNNIFTGAMYCEGRYQCVGKDDGVADCGPAGLECRGLHCDDDKGVMHATYTQCGATVGLGLRDCTKLYQVTEKRDCTQKLVGYDVLDEPVGVCPVDQRVSGCLQPPTGGSSGASGTGASGGSGTGTPAAPAPPVGDSAYVCSGEKYRKNTTLSTSGLPDCNPKSDFTCKSSSDLQDKDCATDLKSAASCYYCDAGKWTPVNGTYYTRNECLAQYHYDVSPTAPEWCQPPRDGGPAIQYLGGLCSGITSQSAIAPHTRDGSNADDDLSSAYLRSDTFDGRNAFYDSISDETKRKLVSKLKDGSMYLYRFGENRQLTANKAEQDLSSFFFRSDSFPWAQGRSATDYELFYPDVSVEKKLFELIQAGDVYIIDPRDNSILCGKKTESAPAAKATCYYCDGATRKQTSAYSEAQCNELGYSKDPGLACDAQAMCYTCNNGAWVQAGTMLASACRIAGNSISPTKPDGVQCDAPVACYSCDNGAWVQSGTMSPSACTAAGKSTSSTKPASCKGPTIVTKAFKIAPTREALAVAAEETYSAPGMSKAWDFATSSNPSPRGLQTVCVQFIDNLNRPSDPFCASIEIVGPDPTLRSVSCTPDLTGSGLTVIFDGLDWSTTSGSATVGTSPLNILEWTDSKITAHIDSFPLNQSRQPMVKITRSDGLFKETSCSSAGVSQIALSAKTFCRAPFEHDQDNVELTLVDDKRSDKIDKRVRIDRTGLIQGLDVDSLQIGKMYRLCLKAPFGLRSCKDFVPQKGTTTINDFLLPLGDIFPRESGDDKINTLDYGELKRQWGVGTKRSGDLNKDEKVNSFDWACMVYDFNKTSDEKPTLGTSYVVQACGGVAGIKCPSGFNCQLTDPVSQSDRQGVCVPK